MGLFKNLKIKKGHFMFVKNLKTLSLIIALLVGALGVLSYYNYIEIQTQKDLKNASLQRVQDGEFLFIKAVISENYQKAEQFITAIGNNIRKDILLYDDYQLNDKALYNDLQNFDLDDHPIINIIGNNFQGQYLNHIVNDNNDPFAFTKQDGIIGDYSVNCSAFGRTRTFEEEYSMHYSPSLAQRAIEKIVNQDVPSVNNGLIEDPIGWSFLPPVDGVEIVESFDWKSLQSTYLKYGLEGLKSYEFLYPYYIDPDQDILGNKIVKASGIRQENAKQLILVSGFNIVDIINSNKNHLVTLEMFKAEKEYVIATYDNSIVIKQIISISTMVIFFLIFMSITTYYNREIDILRETLIKVDEEGMILKTED